MTTATVRIPARYNGPPGSGNGGYSCGLLAAFVDGPARVRLHAPPPLETDLEVRPGPDGQVQMYHADTLVGTAVAAEPALQVPPAPTVDAARDAAERFPCYRDHSYPTCYVCGPGRPQEDGLCLFPGPVADWDLLACTWEPRADTLDECGNVRPEVVWAALDCPGYFAAHGRDLAVTLLGELTAQLRAPVPGNQPLVVYAWPLGSEGRKSLAATAIASGAGEILAVSRSVWITLK